jgi:hypothetical protein
MIFIIVRVDNWRMGQNWYKLGKIMVKEVLVIEVEEMDKIKKNKI